MRNLPRKFIIVFISILIACGTYFTLKSGKNSLKSLPGEIYFVGDIAQNNGGSVISLSEGEINTLQKNNIYYYVDCNENSDKLLLTREITKHDFDDYSIYEYDIKDNTLTPLVERYGSIEDLTTNEFKCVRYVPNSNKISYQWKDEIYLFDRETKETTLITNNCCSNFSWAKDGKSFLYCPQYESKIFSYDLENKNSNFVIEGTAPEYSKDNKNIAFIRSPKSLVIHNITNNTETILELDRRINFYRFSPDSKYIVFYKNGPNIIMPNFYYEIMIWDIDKNKEYKIIKDSYLNVGLDWK